MIERFKCALGIAAIAIAGHAAAQVTFYERDNFQGRSFRADHPISNFERVGFNDRASSIVVAGEPWEVCDEVRFAGRCVILRPGQYPSLAAMGLNNRISSVRTEREQRAEASHTAAPPAASQVTFYEREGFEGRSFTTDHPVSNFERVGFNDRASSVVVAGEPWVACDEVRFGGRCVVLRPGRYPSLAATGLNNRISSVRTEREQRAEANQNTPPPVASQITFYERESFGGRSFTTANPIGDFGPSGFNNRASSVVVEGGTWEICEGASFGGRCVVLPPGRYAALAPMGLDNRVSSARVTRDTHAQENRPVPAPIGAQVIFYSREGFEGRSFTADRQIEDLGRVGFDDRASSVIVLGERWEACSDSEFRGRCVILRPGRYPSLASMGLDNQLSSVRIARRDPQIGERRFAPYPVYDNRRHGEERYMR